MVDKESANGASGAPNAPAAPGADSAPGASGAPGTPAAGTSQEADPAAPAPKRVRRGAIVAAGIVAVVLVAGIGAWVWHEQPSFCNAICHSPMDYYVETYDSGDPNLGVTVHAKAGESCLDCHTAELTTQISEVCAWVSDNYPMTEDGTILATGKHFASE